jgi:hypothetical protein
MKHENNDRIKRYWLTLICVAVCVFPFFVVIANVYDANFLSFFES